MLTLWLKAFHVIGVVTWFAGLFYLPRLLVYHAEATEPVLRERFKVMERRRAGDYLRHRDARDRVVLPASRLAAREAGVGSAVGDLPRHAGEAGA